MQFNFMPVRGTIDVFILRRLQEDQYHAKVKRLCVVWTYRKLFTGKRLCVVWTYRKLFTGKRLCVVWTYRKLLTGKRLCFVWTYRKLFTEYWGKCCNTQWKRKAYQTSWWDQWWVCMREQTQGLKSILSCQRSLRLKWGCTKDLCCHLFFL